MSNQAKNRSGEGFGLFLALGLVNVRRNLGRSMLAVTGATLAAMIITSMIALSSGYPAMGWMSMRAFMGADVIVYHTPHLVRPGSLGGGPLAAGVATGPVAAGAIDPVAAGVATESPAEWSFATVPIDQYSDLQSFHPELYSHGFLSPQGDEFPPLDVSAVESTLAASGHVKGVSPAYFLPSVRLEFDVPDRESPEGTRTVALPRTVLRSRDFGFQAAVGGWPFDQLLVEGRVPGPGEKFAAVGLVDAMLSQFGHEEVPRPGTVARLYVPRVAVEPGGEWVIDYTHQTRFDIEVVGNYATPTGVVAWTSPDGTTMVEEQFWITPQVQVPEGFFAGVFAAVSGGADLTHALQIGVAVTPFSEVENIAAAIQGQLPGASVISVPRQADIAAVRGLPAAAIRAPLEVLGDPTVQQIGLPVDLNQAIIVMVSLIAALLLAANMLFLVAQRRREIGVLKAIGARARDIGLMILTEALTLNLAGMVIGFLVIRVFATWTLISNKIPLAEIGRTTLSDFLVVATAGASAAAAFGLLPAWQMARLTSLEVLRNE